MIDEKILIVIGFVTLMLICASFMIGIIYVCYLGCKVVYEFIVYEIIYRIKNK